MIPERDHLGTKCKKVTSGRAAQDPTHKRIAACVRKCEILFIKVVTAQTSGSEISGAFYYFLYTFLCDTNRSYLCNQK